MISEHKLIVETEKLFNKDDILYIAGNILSLIKPVDIQFVSYISPQKNEQKYFIIFSTQEIEKIEIFRDIINAFIKDAIFLNETDLEIFLSENIYPIEQWQGFSVRGVEKSTNIFEADFLKYSGCPKIQIINISNRKPANKVSRFFNKVDNSLYDKIDNLLYDKINVSAGFFWNQFKDLSHGKNSIVDKFLPFGLNKKIYTAEIVNDIKEIDRKLYPVLNWAGTDCKTISVKLRNGMTTGFDIFEDGDFQYNGAIIGQTGKTSLIKHIAYSHYVKGDKVFIFPLDDQDSYAEILKTVNGQEIVLDIDNPICINPFSFFKDKGLFDYYRDYFIEWIFLMSVKSDFYLSDEDEKYIKFNIDKALVTLWREYRENLTVKDIVNYMKEFNDSRLSVFLGNLDLFLETYGKFFEYKSKVNFDNPFIVINTSKIFHYLHPALLGSLTIAMLINIKVYQHENPKNSLVFIDRFQELTNNIPQIQYVLRLFFRSASKAGISLIFAADINKPNEDFLMDFFSISNWVFVSNISDSVYHFSEKFLLNILRQENIEKIKTLSSGEFLLVNKSKMISEFFRYIN